MRGLDDQTKLVRHFESNEVIFSEGDPGTEFYIVLSGSVSIRRASKKTAQELAVLTTGEFFGEMAIIDGQPRSATALAGQAGAVLMSVDAGRFVYLVTQQPGFALLIMEALSVRQRGRRAVATSRSTTLNRERAYEPIRIADDCYQFRSRFLRPRVR